MDTWFTSFLSKSGISFLIFNNELAISLAKRSYDKWKLRYKYEETKWKIIFTMI